MKLLKNIIITQKFIIDLGKYLPHDVIYVSLVLTNSTRKHPWKQKMIDNCFVHHSVILIQIHVLFLFHV